MERAQRVLRRLAEGLSQIQARDLAGRDFSVAGLECLRDSGALTAPLPDGEGGLGWCASGENISALSEALQLVGQYGLPLGRVYEAHVNAVELLHRYGNDDVRRSAWNDIRNGHLFALWVSSGAEPVQISRNGRVAGVKPFCTAAGHATRAVITAHDAWDGERMVLVDATSSVIDRNALPLMIGMAGSSTKAVTFDIQVPESHCFGEAGDYHREPMLSAGAWRTSAVTVGGLRALVDKTIDQLRARDRHTQLNQSTRIGEMLICAHTAKMWCEQAAVTSVATKISTSDIVAFINLARIAIESACLTVIPLVQRSLGLSAFLETNPVCGLLTDLATYLRQPAGDEVLNEGAVHFAESSRPSSLGTSS